MEEYKEISIDDIVGSVCQPRLQEDHELEDLIESIRINGLRMWISVQKKRDGYWLVCGHRRVKALAALSDRGTKRLPPGEARIVKGNMRIKARVLRKMEAKEVALTSYIENQERKALSPYEQAETYKKLATKFGFSRKELSKRVRVDRSLLDKLIGALSGGNLTAGMITAWRDNAIQQTHVRELYRLRKHRKRQVKLFEEILRRQLNATDTTLLCNHLLDTGDLPLGERQYVRTEKRLLTSKLLKKYFDNKWLAMKRSSRGEQLTIKYASPQELRTVAREIDKFLKGFETEETDDS